MSALSALRLFRLAYRIARQEGESRLNAVRAGLRLVRESR